MSKHQQKIVPVENPEDFGVYIWLDKAGNPFQDDDGNTLNIPSRNYDIQKMKIIAEAAAYWGCPEGTAKFLPGVGRLTESEFESEKERMLSGLTPYGDTGAWRETFKNARN